MSWLSILLNFKPPFPPRGAQVIFENLVICQLLTITGMLTLHAEENVPL